MEEKHIVIMIGYGRSYEEYKFPIKDIDCAIDLLHKVKNDSGSRLPHLASPLPMPKVKEPRKDNDHKVCQSICDPLQDAILSTEMACERAKDGNDVTLRILQKHLMNLHALQIEMLREKPEPMFPEYDLRA